MGTESVRAERSRPSRARRRSRARGAVYVEFLIAFLPVFVFFMCMVQLALLFAAKLEVEHAAVQGARAAAVVFGDQPGPYGEAAAATNVMTEERRRTVRDAVLLSMAPLILNGSVAAVRVAFPRGDEPGGADQPPRAKLAPLGASGPSLVRVRVETDFVCKIALADAIVCGGYGNGLRGLAGLARAITLHAESVFPYQGASYVYAK